MMPIPTRFECSSTSFTGASVLSAFLLLNRTLSASSAKEYAVTDSDIVFRYHHLSSTYDTDNIDSVGD